MNRWVVVSAVLLGTIGITSAGPGIGAKASGAVACRTADLSDRIKAGSPGAGQRYATVVLTNVSARTCTIKGYGGLALLGAPGQGVPTDLRRVGTSGPTRVDLHPGGSARSLLHWTVVQASDEQGSVCQPTAVTAVLTPPDQTTAALVPWRLGPVCQHGRIDQNPYVPGAAAF
jgi:hypothetical protein